MLDLLKIDIERVKDPMLIVLKPLQILIEIQIMNDTGLIIPSSVVKSSITEETWVIINKGSAVEFYEIGDVVVDVHQQGGIYLQKLDSAYVIMDQHNVKVVTPQSNYDFPEVKK